MNKFILVLSNILMSAGVFFSQSDTLWVKAIGGAQFEQASEIIACDAGGYALVGTTGSNETGSTDILVARLDAELNCLWTANFGGANVEWGMGITEDWSGNLLIAGYTLSYGAGSYDMLVIKVSPSGELMWQQTYGGNDWDFGKKIVRHPQGGFLVCGNTYSNGNGGQDGTILHIDGQGVLLNQRYIGGIENDAIHDVMPVNDGWIACGYETLNNVLKSTVWRFDFNGNEVWTRTMDDPYGFDREALAMTSDTSFLFITGPVHAEGITHSFELQLGLDNAVFYEVLEENNFDANYYDCAQHNGEVVYAGSKSLSGIELGRVVRKRTDTAFTGAFEFTGQHRTRFLCAIWNEEGLVLCGAFQPTQSENWQALVVKYASPILNEVAVEPELIPCFALGIEEIDRVVAGEWGRVYNATGQLVKERFQWGGAAQQSELSGGFYVFQSIDGLRAQTFVVH